MTQQINLVNPAYRKEFKAFSGPIAAGGWVATWALFLVGHWLLGLTNEPMESKKSALTQKHAEATAAITKMQELAKSKKPSKALEDENGRLESTLRLQREILLSLETGGLGSTEGFSRYLTAFARQRLDGVWLVGITTSGTDSNLTLRGRAVKPELVPGFIKLLSREETLRGHTFSELTARSSGAKGAGKSVDAKKESRDGLEPERYIEFSLNSTPSTARAGPSQ